MGAPDPLPPADYARVLHFYARQTWALDDGRADEYALTFAEDAVFDHAPDAEPIRGRSAVRAASAAVDRSVVRRHWFDQVVADRLPDGGIRTRLYALVVRTTPGGPVPEVWPSCLLEDVLADDGDALTVTHRTIRYDHSG